MKLLENDFSKFFIFLSQVFQRLKIKMIFKIRFVKMLEIKSEMWENRFEIDFMENSYPFSES